MTTKTMTSRATVSALHLADAHGGLKRVAAILDRLDAHESNVSTKDDRETVAAIRFALLDAAKAEVAALVDETTLAKQRRAA